MKSAGIKFLIVVITFLLLVGCWNPSPAQAAGERLLPDGMVIGDDKGLKCQPDGKFMVEINDAFPGNKWKSNITIMNLEEGSTYEITFQVLETTYIQGKIDLTKAINMKLTYDGKVVYEGTVRGTPGTGDVHSAPISLGNFKPGDKRTLVAEFEMDHTYSEKDYVIKNIAENVWEFRAMKPREGETETSQSDGGKSDNPDDGGSLLDKLVGKLPQTGEEWKNTLLYISLGLLIIILVLLIIKKRMDKRKENH